MEGFDKKEGAEREEIFSKAIRAGKRTYFFDVKATKRNDYYLTITERKKRFDQDGNFQVEKHKLFLYKEDFDKFTDGLTETVEYIKELLEKQNNFDDDNQNEDDYTNVDFEDLDK